jgi:general L-amino acid transport system substrate-binding protein
MMQFLLILISMWLVAVPPPASAAPGPTLNQVRANGVVRCGVSEGMLGFALKDEAGHWQGFSIDFCRAVAAAALGQADKVSFVTVTAPSRFPVLLSGKIDLLMRNTTYTFEREAAIGVRFAGIYYYDGQAFMVPRSSGIGSLADLNGATICLGRRTTHEVNLADYFQRQGWTFTPVPVETLQELRDNFIGGRCQAVTADRAELVAIRQLAANGPEVFEILPETISKEPLGPVVRKDDEEWQTVVKWVLYALIEAEERGITQANVRGLLETSADPGTRRFLASDGLPEKALGLKPGWVVRVIEAVGNYGEIFERHLGSQSQLKLDRGLNRLWTQGGLLFAPPFR